jgi:hypothetical protein
MSQQNDQELSLRRYLLAEMDDAERERIEERLFADEGFAEELEQAESRLIDDYAFNVLTPQDREKFERNFILNDERCNDLLFARAMDSYLETQTASAPKQVAARRGPLPLNKVRLSIRTHRKWGGAAAAAIMLLIIGVPLGIWWLRQKEQLRLLELRRERIERLVLELNRRPFSQQTLALPSVDLELQSTQLRGSGQMEQVEIDNDVKVLNLGLLLPTDEHPKYSVVVKTVDGNKLFSVDDLLPEKNQGGSSVLVRVPTEVLPTNDYQLDLNGMNPNGQTTISTFKLRVINPTLPPTQ